MRQSGQTGHTPALRDTFRMSNRPDSGAENINERLLEINDILKALQDIKRPAQRINEIPDEISRSDAYKNLIASRGALKDIQFDIDEDGIITNEEFKSVGESIWAEKEVLEIEKKTLNEEQKNNYTDQAFMGQPDIFLQVGLIPTGAVAALLATTGPLAQKKKEQERQTFQDLLIQSGAQDYLDSLYEQAEEWERKAEESQEKMDKLQRFIDRSREIDEIDNEEEAKNSSIALLKEHGVHIDENSSHDDIATTRKEQESKAQENFKEHKHEHRYAQTTAKNLFKEASEFEEAAKRIHSDKSLTPHKALEELKDAIKISKTSVYENPLQPADIFLQNGLGRDASLKNDHENRDIKTEQALGHDFEIASKDTENLTNEELDLDGLIDKTPTTAPSQAI